MKPLLHILEKVEFGLLARFARSSPTKIRLVHWLFEAYDCLFL